MYISRKFISVGRSGAGAIFPPSSSRLHACASPVCFKPPGYFIQSRFVRPGTFSTRLVRRLRMLSLSRFRPASVWLLRPACGRGGRSKRGKISVKCQIAKYIWNFCEKGECGALAMIYLVRLSRLGGPDVL